MPSVRSTVLTMSIALAGAGAAGGAVIASADSGESGKDPNAILEDVQRDLGQVKSLHFAGSEKDKDGTTKLSADVIGTTSASISLTEGTSTARMILLAHAAYLKGNAAFWKTTGKNGSAVAKKVGDHWVKVPGKSVGGISALIKEFSPKQLASCMDAGVGTLTKKSTGTLDGRPIVVLQDAGDKPGTTPGLLYVTTDGPILPLRAVQTGKRKAGGKIDKTCQDADDTSTSSDLTFSNFNKVAKITAPKHAVALEDLAGSGGGSIGTPS
jgi:hypothetical protein